MLNTSDNQILYHLSEKFRNSECMEFLTPILDKYDKELSLIHFSKHPYHKKLYGIEIDYQKTEDKTEISINENNDYIGNLTIRINKYKNNITIIDNVHHFTDLEKNNTKQINLAISTDSTSYIEYRSYRNYYSPKKKQLSFSKLVIDPMGNLIYYYDKDHNNVESIDNKEKIKI